MAAYDRETFSMYSLGGMEIVQKPRDHQVLDLVELFSWKYYNLTQMTKAKVRFVVRGDQEILHEPKTELYSPVAELVSFRVLISLATTWNWHIAQADVSTAFLNASVDRDVYIRLPRGEARWLAEMRLENPDFYLRPQSRASGLA